VPITHQSGAAEEIITMKTNKTAMEKCLEKGLSIKPLRLRLVRVELDSEVEVLITNLLDNERYPARGFKALYHLRWGVEENYKRLKMWVELENFTGKSVLSVKQDFYARVLSGKLLSSERLKKRLTDLIGYIACTLEPVCPNRSYDRKVCKTNGGAFSMNYKRAK
jgi:hypothetical protein